MADITPQQHKTGVAEWMREHLVLTLIGTLLIGMGIGVSSGSQTEPSPDPAPAVAATDDSEPEPVEEPEPEPPAEPEGEFGLATCDIGDEEFIGSTEVINTGEVPAEVEVTFKWLLGNGASVKAENKIVTLRPGQERYVFFNQAADIDTRLSFQSHPDYYDSTNCKTKANIR